MSWIRTQDYERVALTTTPLPLPFESIVVSNVSKSRPKKVNLGLNPSREKNQETIENHQHQNSFFNFLNQVFVATSPSWLPV